MIRKILLILIPLLILSSAVLWWLGNRALEQREQEAERVRQEAVEAERLAQQDAERAIAAVSTTTLAIATQAIENKSGAPLQTLAHTQLRKTTYTYGDIKVTSGDGSVTKASYSKAIQTILTKYSAGLTGDERTAMLNYFQTGKTAELDKLRQSHQHIQTTIDALVATPTPASATFFHLQLLNSMASLDQVIYNMSQANTEPLLASESAELYQDQYYRLLLAISALDRYLAKP